MFDDIRVEALDCSIVLYADTLCDVKNEVREEDFELYKEDFELIKKYKPDFEWPIKICETPSVSNESGCYVATSIYGSYDCPQVWTLRRFRDNTLENYWAGRTFIKTYYAISPTLVKWFGESSIFKCVLTPILDRMVRLLKDKGVSDKPYNDKY